MDTIKSNLQKIISTALIAFSLLITQTVQANEIEQIMLQMKKEYRSATKSTTVAEMAQHILLLKNCANRAINLKYDGPTDEQTIYRQGMQDLINSYNKLELMLTTGNLDQAKIMLEAIKNIQKEYHQKLDV